MGTTVSFPSNGSEAAGYLAESATGSGAGVLVIQEWWGLDPSLKGVADKLAAEGFTALAPDLYHGELAGHTEMDKAAQLMNALPQDRAARDMVGAIDYLLGHSAVSGDKVGVVGFCMGGMLSFVIGAVAGDKVGAVVPFYGAPLGDGGPDWSNLSAPIQGHFAEHDDFFPPDAVNALGEKLEAMGKAITIHVYPGTGHAFAGDHNALGTFDNDAAAQAWSRTLEFLRKNLT